MKPFGGTRPWKTAACGTRPCSALGATGGPPPAVAAVADSLRPPPVERVGCALRTALAAAVAVVAIAALDDEALGLRWQQHVRR